MSKYKVGDKIILTVTGMDEKGGYQYYELNDNFNLWEQSIDKYSEPLSTYTEPLEAKIRRQAAEITRLLEENKELKEDFEKSKRVNLNMGRLAGQNESWELARKIINMPLKTKKDIWGREVFLPTLDEILDEIFKNTYPEAAAKVAEWEKTKEIKVGDVLEYITDNNVKCVVTKPHSSNMAYFGI